MTQKVLIVDDEPDIRELLEITLSRMNLSTMSAGNLGTARKLLAANKFDLCLTDMRLPDGDGLELVKDIQNNYQNLPVAVITAHGSTETAITALKSGAFDFLSKPVDLPKLRILVHSALKLSQPEPSAPSRSVLADSAIIGQSTVMLALKQQITKLARSQAPVFICGESGSGKELVARAIHSEGPRKGNNFVPINCGAIPTELMESEFFGHKKGSFTGAEHDKIGFFQAANGGSLFLDEIADLPLHMQVKLLRAIQEKAIRPVGSQTEIPVDIRVLSATHKNLTQAIEKGTFRQDLYYRINVIELQVPALRERADDIPLLVQHIMKTIRQTQSSSPSGLSDAALAAIRGYAFPGNVRELENMLQRACALSDADTIELSDLPELAQSRFDGKQKAERVPGHNGNFADDIHFSAYQEPEPSPTRVAESVAASEAALPPAAFSLEQHLENIERQAFQKALEDCRWNRTEAAKKLGMSFRSFRYRLKKLGLE
ncbi:MAG: sigma-54 dependent transcriptional regulator [Pseudomonadota bacterium]